MKKIALLFTILCVGALSAIENPEYGQVPNEVLMALQSSNRLDKVIQNIIEARSFNREINMMLNEDFEGFTNIVNILATKFKTSPYEVALTFQNTPVFTFKSPMAKRYIELYKSSSEVLIANDPFNEFPGAKNIKNKSQQSLIILGLPDWASQAEIKKAYFELAKKWHPDKWSDKSVDEQKYAESVFKLIQDAYDTLKTK